MRATTVCLRSARVPGLPADLELSAALYLPSAAGAYPVPGLIVGHGAGSRGARHGAFCREVCAQGFAVLALDFRGHGDSAGAADGPLEEDILGAARFLRGHAAVDGAHICYRGSSMGGFYGLKAAAGGDLTAIVLVCPASEQVMLDGLNEVDGPIADSEAATDPTADGDATTGSPAGGPSVEPGGAAHPAAPTRWDVPRLRTYFEQQRSLELAGRVYCPALLIHAREDEVVPFGHSLALAEHLGGDATLLALAGGTHTTAQHDPTVHELTARWLLEQVRSACTART